MQPRFDDFNWVYGQDNSSEPEAGASNEGASNEGAGGAATNAAPEGNQPAGAAGGSPAGDDSPFGGMGIFLLMGLVFVAFIYFTRRSERRRRSEQEIMFAALEKGQRVMLKSGIYGKVERVNKDEQEILLVVDESKNIIMTFSLMAVADVIKEEKSSVKKDY